MSFSGGHNKTVGSRDEGLTSVSTWTLTFNWLSLYWFALETCSSIPHSTASHPVHLTQERKQVEGGLEDTKLRDKSQLCARIQRGYWPLLQCIDYVWELVWTEVTTYAAVYLHLLVSLVQFPLDDVTVNSFNQQVLQFPHILQFKLLQEQWVWQALRKNKHIKQLQSSCTIFFFLWKTRYIGSKFD